VIVEIRDQNADGKRLLLAQGASVEAGTVIELCGSLKNAVARFLRNGADAGGIVEDQGDGGWGQVEILAKGPEADGLSGERFCS